MPTSYSKKAAKGYRNPAILFAVLVATVSFLLLFVNQLVAGPLTQLFGRASTAEVIYPSQVFDLTNWKLTIPEQNTAKAKCDDGTYPPKEIKQTDTPSLNTYANSQYFFLNGAKNGIVFKAPVNGAHTCGSNYSRSELREMKDDGKNEADWSSISGKHSMEISQAVLHLPVTKPHVVVGQIHDSGDDVVVFRVEGPKPGQAGGIKLYVNADGDSNDVVLTNNYVLGTPFTVKFEVENGRTTYFYNGQPVMKNGQVAVLTRNYSGAYFKAGSYVQASCTYASDGWTPEDCSSSIPYAEVEIYNVTVCHDGVCRGGTNNPVPTTPIATTTPVPTVTPIPTSTPRPTVTPTPTPKPSATPTPTPKPTSTPIITGKVTGLTVRSPKDSRVEVKWEPYPGVKEYKIMMAKGSPLAKYSVEETTSKTSKTLDLPSCKTFFFRVEAFDKKGKKLAVSDTASVLVAIGNPVHPCE